MRTDPALLRKPLADALGWPQEVVDWFVANAPPEIFEEAFAPWLPMLSDMIQNRIRGELPAIMKKSHIRALTTTVSPVARADSLRNLVYATVAHPSGDLILGDSIVLFEVTGSRPYKTLLEGVDELKAVYLPLSPGLVLVDTTDPNSGVPSNLPDAIARCSFEFFIGDRVTPTYQRRQARIGETAAPISNEELDDIVNSSLSD